MDLKKENKRLEAWIDDLQSGMYINCVYCGHRYGPDDDVKIPMRGQLEKHIEQCPKHPLSKAKAELSTLRSELGKAKADIVCMVNKAADNHLEGYRELGRRAAEAENKRDRLRAANRELVEALKALCVAYIAETMENQNPQLQIARELIAKHEREVGK